MTQMKMNKKNRINDLLKWFAGKLLPIAIFIPIAKVIYPLFNSTRRWPNIEVKMLESHLFSIKTQNEPVFYFYEFTRIERYLFPNPIKKIMNVMLDKYSFEMAEIVVQKGDTIVEVGANIGEFSRAAASLGTMLVCIEPDPIAYKCLELNLMGFTNIYLYNVVCAENCGNIDFYISSSGADSSIIEPVAFEKIVTKECLTLDTIITERKIHKIDFLKIEAEGAEPEVLLGARNSLNITRKIAVDCGPERKGASTRDAVYGCLIANGFDVYEKENMVYGKKK